MATVLTMVILVAIMIGAGAVGNIIKELRRYK